MNNTRKRLLSCLFLCIILLAGVVTFSACAAPSESVSSRVEQAVVDPAAVVFADIQTGEDIWFIQYLQQAGILAKDPAGASLTVADMNALLHETITQIAAAAGRPEPAQYNYFVDGAPSDKELLYVLDIFVADCEAYSPWATEPNVRIETLKQLCADQGEIGFVSMMTILAVLHKTELYIADFDPEWYAIKGSDYMSEGFKPTRIGKPLEEIDMLTDYDFEQLHAVTRQLSNIDRRRSLSGIFTKVTQGAQTDHEKYMAVLEFLAQAGFHTGSMQPIHEDGTLVSDPLVLLELGEMLCGHVAGLACDLFEAGGYPARLVQAGGHILAEVYYGEDWHYFDADTNIVQPVVIDGAIPSMVALSYQPYLIDTTGNWWLMHDAEVLGFGVSAAYKAANYFGRDTYTYPPLYKIKTATTTEELNIYYGWDLLIYEDDDERQLYDDIPAGFTPSSPVWESITYDASAGGYRLQWKPSYSSTDGLAGYRISVSEASRGWDWHTFYGEEALLAYRSLDGYRPEDQARMSELPPSEVALIDLDADTTEVFIEAEAGQVLYVSAVAYDEYGEMVGNQLYPPSNEIVLTF